jgi:uncharacterized protein YbaR (Trm112 family)
LFIEISEFLRCPQSHEDSFCVVVPHEMAGRMIVRGVVGCPVCKREYPIADGVVRFGETAEAAAAAEAAEPDAIWALLGLTSPGGLVVLVGSAVRLAGELARRMGGVHFVGMNAAEGIAMSPALTLLRHPDRIPLRHAVARGVVLGPEAAAAPWIGEGARVLLNGQRLVAVAETIAAPALDQLAAGQGLWVGQKRAG